MRRPLHDVHTRLVALVALSMLFGTRTASASPTSKLTYVRGPGAEQCAEEGELRRYVAQRLGYDPFFAWADRTVVAQIDAVATGFRGQVRIIDAKGALLGERTLDAPAKDCGELVKSLALAISIAIDDLDAVEGPSASSPSRPRPTPEPAAVDVPSVATERPDAPSAPDRPERAPTKEAHDGSGIGGFATVGALGGVGSAPSASLGAVVGGGVVGSWWSMALEGRAEAPASGAMSGGGRISTSRLAATLVPCARLGARLALSLCAVGSLGMLRASAEGVSAPRDDSALASSLGGRAGLDHPLAEWLGAYVDFEAGAPLERHRVELNGSTTYVMPGGYASFGLGLRASSR
jgi:hypothetical protein